MRLTKKEWCREAIFYFTHTTVGKLKLTQLIISTISAICATVTCFPEASCDESIRVDKIGSEDWNWVLTGDFCFDLFRTRDKMYTSFQISFWISSTLLTWIISIVLCLLQLCDTYFVKRYDGLLYYYHGTVWMFYGTACVCGIFNHIAYSIFLFKYLPNFITVVVGTICGTATVILHKVIFYHMVLHGEY